MNEAWNKLKNYLKENLLYIPEDYRSWCPAISFTDLLVLMESIEREVENNDEQRKG